MNTINTTMWEKNFRAMRNIWVYLFSAYDFFRFDFSLMQFSEPLFSSLEVSIQLWIPFLPKLMRTKYKNENSTKKMQKNEMPIKKNSQKMSLIQNSNVWRLLLECQSLPCLSRNLKENIKLLFLFNVFIRRMVYSKGSKYFL